jgi:hypothetical protein
MPLPWPGWLDSRSQSHASISIFRSRWTLLIYCTIWLGLARAMTPAHIAELRKETVDMFYHGFDNYMDIAFPEDEVRPMREIQTLHVLISI